MNYLTGKKGLAYTSANPGCTQLINFYRVDGKLSFRRSSRLRLRPGSSGRQGPLEELIESYLLNRKTLELAVVLLDARRGWMEKDLELKDWLESQKVQYVVVATKD